MTRKPFYFLNEDSITFLKRGYLAEGQDPIDRFRVIADTAERYLNKPGFADKFFDYLGRGYYSLATPVLSNFGTDRGLPCSCNSVTMDDSVESILDKIAEISFMSKMGAGTAVYMGNLRARGSSISTGGKSNGPCSFAPIAQSSIDGITQGSQRRGACVVILPVEHLDISDWLDFRSEGNPVQTLSFGITIKDAWMNSMIEGDKAKRKIWGKIIKKRFESGYPYIFFHDTVNNNAPKALKDKGLVITNSQLCQEICNFSDSNYSYTCNLSSINLVHWDEIKDSDVVQTLAYFLDSVISEYIEKTKDMKYMQNARRFSMEHRSMGIGVLGWHSLLQSKRIPFEDMRAKYLTSDIFKFINEESLKASKQMAIEYGEPEVLKGYGERNITRVAVAPTTSSSFIFGAVSPSIEPEHSVYYSKDLSKGKFTYRNPYLKELLGEYEKDTRETWKSILEHGGSVQHLKFLTQNERDTFKTFSEISMKEVIIQNSIRQKHIDQAVSLNLIFHPNTSAKEVSELMIEAWKLGTKTLYYQRSMSPTQELVRNLNTCKSCEA